MPRVDDSSRLPRVYCAGPLFNAAERDEMAAIAGGLEAAGFAVFLPHRDGMEFRCVHEVLVGRGWPADRAGAFLHAAIFALDVFQLAERCDAMVWNLNGRVPDEGAVSEAAIAWTLGKPLLAYMDDARSLIAGRINPLLAGLVDFETVSNIDEVPQVLLEMTNGRNGRGTTEGEVPRRLQETTQRGRRLWSAMQSRDARLDDERIADVVAELFAAESQPAVATS